MLKKKKKQVCELEGMGSFGSLTYYITLPLQVSLVSSLKAKEGCRENMLGPRCPLGNM